MQLNILKHVNSRIRSHCCHSVLQRSVYSLCMTALVYVSDFVPLSLMHHGKY